MSLFILIALVLLVCAILYQIAKASELTSLLNNGEEKSRRQTNRLMAVLLVLFFLVGMYGVYFCHQFLKERMLPISASDHGVEYDHMFLVTTIVTGIVFFITQAILFWFCWRYQDSEKNKQSFFYAHNNKLELVWTTIPAIAMAVLVAIGLKNWFLFTSPAPANAQIVEIVGKQFNWLVRYPGKDGVLGDRNFRYIDEAKNVLGLDWSNKYNMDDIISQTGEMHMVVGKPIKLVIGSRDVIHNVGLTHFRLKMDAVPGIMTTLWFTPTITTQKMKEITGNSNFVYEISCDQMCGKGHYSMKGTIVVETQEEYNKYMAGLKTYYAEVNTTPEASPKAADTTSKQAITMNH